MRWSSHIAKGCVPAEPIVYPREAAFSRTAARSPRSCSAASAVVRHGWVATSSTDSCSSGLISPPSTAGSSSIASMALASSSVSASRIISSSSMPIVYLGPVNLWSTVRAAYPGVDSAQDRIPRQKDGYGARLRRQAVHPRVRPPRLVPEEDVRHPGRSHRGRDPQDRRYQAPDLRGDGQGRRAWRRARGGGRPRRRAVRRRHPGSGQAERAGAGHAGREERPGGVRLRVRRAVRRAHRALRPGLLQGPRPLQPRRRRRDERAPDRAAQAARGLAARPRPQVPLRAAGGRDGVVCVVLGRGASIEKVDQWLRAGAPVDGYVGFAIGRSIWWDALKTFLDGSLEREQAAEQIAGHYLRFIQVYEEATAKVA